MEKVLLSIIVASGLCAVSSHAARQFHVVYERKNWTEAQSYCREHYTDLATVDNMDNVNSLINLTRTGRYRNWAWIGLHRTDMYSWMWSLTNSSFYKHGEMEFRNWSKGEPTNRDKGPNCGLMGDDGLWSDTSCSGLYKAVCCDVQGSNVTYHLTSNNMSWTGAQSFCREHYTDLVSVRNNAENEKVKELAPGTGVWIGLFRDSWKWSDGSNSSFRFWDEGRPSNGARYDCVMAHPSSGQWHDYLCHYTLPFVCYNLTEELAPTTAAMTTEQVTKLAPTTAAMTTEQVTKLASTTAAVTTEQVTKLAPTTAAVMTEQVTKLAPEAPVMTRQVFKLNLRVEDGENLDDEAMMEALLEQVKQKLKDQGLEHVKVSFRKQADGKFFTKEEKKKDEF